MISLALQAQQALSCLGPAVLCPTIRSSSSHRIFCQARTCPTCTHQCVVPGLKSKLGSVTAVTSLSTHMPGSNFLIFSASLSFLWATFSIRRTAIVVILSSGQNDAHELASQLAWSDGSLRSFPDFAMVPRVDPGGTRTRCLFVLL